MRATFPSKNLIPGKFRRLFQGVLKARPLSRLALATTMWLLTMNAATASFRDDECFGWYRYYGAVPGEPSCKARALAAAASCDPGNSNGCHDAERLQRFCDEPIRQAPPNCRSGSHDVGNPIDSSTGNKHLLERDYAGTGLFPLVFERYYNSMSVLRAGGDAWRSSYSQSLTILYPEGGGFADLVYVTRPDGRIIHYRRGATGWIADADSADRLRELRAASGNWTTGWEWTNAADDSVEHYDSWGQLTRITSRHGQSHTLTWNSVAGYPELIRVTDHFGRQLNFTYEGGRKSLQMVEVDRGSLFTHKQIIRD